MRAIKRQFLADSFKIVDILLLLLALIGSEAAVNPPFTLNRISDLLIARFSLRDEIYFGIVAFFWHFSFLKLGVYDCKHLKSFWDETKLVIFGIICCELVVIIGKISTIDFFNLTFFILFFLFSICFLISSRFLLRLVLGFIGTNRRNLHYVLIAGTGNRAQQYAHRIKNNPQLGYVVKGFIDTYWHHGNQKTDDLPGIVTDFDNFADYLKDNVVDEILVCLPMRTHYEIIHKLIIAAEEQGIIAKLATDLFFLKSAKVNVEHLGGQTLIALVTGGMYRRMVLYKSLFDFFSSLILLIITSPILLSAAIVIKLTSKGPIFFLQPRIGMNKRIFHVVKFRTMVVDAEERIKEIAHLNERKDGAAFKIKNDPRVTYIGKFLRKFSIDELPQLFNVIKGNMSLVGPRPLPIRDYREFNQDWHRRRFSVKPGITCIWQVSGRDDVPFERWMQMDMEYIDKWNIWLDLKILLKTIPAALFGIGAS
jgi:exopolysaccharide biosynthesis polyprenyl glycosylphosphotransferase